MVHLSGEKCIEWPESDIDGFKVKKYPYGFYIEPRGPNFHPFHSARSRFHDMGKFCELCAEWRQMAWYIQG